jgi:hypothetical protein
VHYPGNHVSRVREQQASAGGPAKNARQGCVMPIRLSLSADAGEIALRSVAGVFHGHAVAIYGDDRDAALSFDDRQRDVRGEETPPGSHGSWHGDLMAIRFFSRIEYCECDLPLPEEPTTGGCSLPAAVWPHPRSAHLRRRPGSGRLRSPRSQRPLVHAHHPQARSNHAAAGRSGSWPCRRRAGCRARSPIRRRVGRQRAAAGSVLG